MYYEIGLDGYNVLLVLLTAFLGPLVVAGAFSAIQKDVKLFYITVLLMQFAMLGAFLAQDLFVFYLFWEAMMIPMFLIIGIWGGERRIYATIKFVLYTAFGSILMLAAVIYLVYSLQSPTGELSFAFADLYRARLPLSVQIVLLSAFGLSFAIKVPIVPLHTWLPDAHVEAPTAGSVILAGVLLKMGTYGFMKLGFPLFPDATRYLMPLLLSLAVISIVYGACLALVQNDIKKIIAYSSISHLGYVMLGLVEPRPHRHPGRGDPDGQPRPDGGRALPDGRDDLRALPYARTRRVRRAGEAAARVLGVLHGADARVDRPADDVSGFTGEFLVLLGAGTSGWHQYQAGDALPLAMSIVAVGGVVLGALYMLRFAQSFLFGAAKVPHAPVADLVWREKLILAAIVAAVFALGLFPDGPMRKTELAAKEFRSLVTTSRLPEVKP